jgi:O-methyltransferase involved in polyketide biosynthesis
MTTTDPNLHKLDTSMPNASRIYDYTLGGSVNFEADRMAAEAMFQLLPSTRKWVNMLRSFLQEAAQTLHEEGFRQFLDLASGLPTQDHIHAVVPDARIIYNDIDPLTVNYARNLLADTPNVRFVPGDLRQVNDILNSAAVKEMIDLNEKLAIGFNGINVFLTAEEIQHIAQTLYDWSPSGSKIFLTYETKNPEKTTPQFEQFLGMFAATGSPMHLYSLEKNLEWMKPWQPETLAPVSEFLGLPQEYVTDEDREGVDLEFYAAIMQK